MCVLSLQIQNYFEYNVTVHAEIKCMSGKKVFLLTSIFVNGSTSPYEPL